MPSFIVNNVSGGDRIIAGFPYSRPSFPTGGVQIVLDYTASGSAYIGLSGGVTIRSGVHTASGGVLSGGMLDGMQVNPGGSYFIPAAALVSKGGTASGLSGFINIYASVDPGGSGQARLYFEFF